MQYYNNNIREKFPELIHYFEQGIFNENKNLGHGILFWGPDIKSQCELALEIARMLNCKCGGKIDCDCLNCRWIKAQTHPVVKIYTRLDFKEDSENGTKNISIEQAKEIIEELSVSSDYHRVYIFCDRDEDGNLLPLNKINFPEATSNALLKTFEEPPQNTTFIFLTRDKSDIISTIVSRVQTYFVPSILPQDLNFSLVENIISNYWEFPKNKVLDFENNLTNLINSNKPQIIFTQIQNYIYSVMRQQINNKPLFYKLLRDFNYVEEAIKQTSLARPILSANIVENLCFKLILQT